MQAERGSDLSTIPQKCRAWPGGNPDRLWPQEIGSQTLMRTQTAWSTKGSPADQGCPKNKVSSFLSTHAGRHLPLPWAGKGKS